MIAYDTLLDLARQRLSDIARSPNFTREARHVALDMERTVEKELADFNAGQPQRCLFELTPQAKAA